MMEWNYHRILPVGVLLLVVFICSGQAITTEELVFRENAQSSEPAPSVAAAAVNLVPNAKSLTPDQEGPLTAGSTIVWTGDAYDPDGDKLLYQFWLNGPATGNTWKPMTNWNEDNTWNWSTSPIDSGVNIIDMRVRDGHHAAPWGHDSHISAEYGISNNNYGIGGGTRTNSEPTLLSVKSDKQSPQDKGVKVTWTAKGSDPDKDTILYQYVLKGPSTEEQWLPMTTWTTNNVWTWDTGQAKAGIYMIEVWIRDGYHADVDNSDDTKRMPYVVMQKGIIE